jgi:hypothetical protein
MNTRDRALKVLNAATGPITCCELSVRSGLTLKQSSRVIETLGNKGLLDSHYLPPTGKLGKPPKAHLLKHRTPPVAPLPLGHSVLEVARAHPGNPFALLFAGPSAINCTKEIEYDDHD